ncbi:MAG: DUF2807 domain-containing protein [Chthoniobacterales bacterium]|nr:DUF2807 domain-containing protein [Chthoniobacterales bacterium]
MNTIPIRPLLTLKLVTLAALAFVMLLLSGCHWVGVKGNGDIKTENREIAAFTRVEADGAFQVNWTSGPPAFSITTDENLLEYVRTHVSGDRLRIDWVKPLKGTRGIKIKISSATLSRAELNGAVRFAASGLSGPEFYLEANGATRVGLDGNVNAMQGELNGASRLDATRLVTRAIDLSISGAGRADVNVSDVLKVDISGAGKVTYSGNPKTVDRNIAGAGSIKRRE